MAHHVVSRSSDRLSCFLNKLQGEMMLNRFWIWLLRRSSYVRHMEEVADRAQDLIMGKITIEELIMRNGEMSISVNTELAQVWAVMAANMLDEMGAANCIEMIFSNKEGRSYIFTLQRGGGKSPMDLLRDAEKEIKRLQAEGRAIRT